MLSPGGKIKVTADLGSRLYPFLCFLYFSEKENIYYHHKKIYNWQRINLADFFWLESTF